MELVKLWTFVTAREGPAFGPNAKSYEHLSKSLDFEAEGAFLSVFGISKLL